MTIDEAEYAIKKAPGALDALFAPFEIFFRRSGKERVEPAGVRAEFIRHLVGTDDVAFGFGHGGAAFEHHALREEPFDRFVMRDEAEAAHHFAPEARIEQMQNG